jgi:hypothetical protein
MLHTYLHDAQKCDQGRVGQYISPTRAAVSPGLRLLKLQRVRPSERLLRYPRYIQTYIYSFILTSCLSLFALPSDVAALAVISDGA